MTMAGSDKGWEENHSLVQRYRVTGGSVGTRRLSEELRPAQRPQWTKQLSHTIVWKKSISGQERGASEKGLRSDLTCWGSRKRKWTWVAREENERKNMGLGVSEIRDRGQI